MIASSQALLGLCALAAASVAPPADRLVFSVAPGARVEKVFTLDHGLILKDIQSGAEGSGLLQQGFEVSSQVTLKVLDTYRQVGEGRPLVLQRVFKDAGLHADMQTADARDKKASESWDAECPIEEVSVVFTWVPEESSYGRHFDQGESLEEYLGGLREDLDYRALLPDGPVAQGDSWKLAPDRCIGVFAPGGKIPLGFTKGGGGNFVRALASGVGGPLHEVFGGDLEGAGSAAWRETREENGARLAVIGLAIEIHTKRDRTAAARAEMNTAELVEERAIDHAGVEWKFRGEGTLVWNLTAGRFETFELTGSEECSHEMTLRSGASEPSRQSVAMAGSLRLTGKAVAKK